MRLDDSMRRVIREQSLGFVATVTPDGRPNLSPKGTTTIFDDEHLMFADVASPGTVANLVANPAIEINVVDPILRRGYRFRGTAEILRDGPLFERAFAQLQREGFTTARDRIHSLVIVAVHEVEPLLSPAYGTGATESEIRDRWLKHHNTLNGRA